MLVSAYDYQDQLNKALAATWYEEKYMFYHDSWRERVEIDKGDWNKRQFVSIDKSGKLLGFISYSIDRANDSINNLAIINLSDDKMIFGKDVHKAFADIFEKYNFRKIKFTVIIGNPIEKQYDKIISTNGGRVVGTLKQHVKLMDNRYYDEKIYEIFRDDYLKKKGERHDTSKLSGNE
jgi:RimJ/RimL family protein N-acetyltransferase